MDPQRKFLTDRYQQLWDGAVEHVRAGAVNMDPLLAKGEPDQRRCLTVLIRPSASVQSMVADFLDRLRQIDPHQYYYQSPELHVTVLSLFTATLEFEMYLRRYDEYLAAVKAALANVRPFCLEFTGVTLTRDAVMIQGYFDHSILNDTRDALRKELRARDLTVGLDSRYILQTAHMTAVRFRNPLPNSQKFTEVLEFFRPCSFGRVQIQELEFVRNDWYMSTQSVEVLKRFQLSSDSTPQVSQPI